MMASSKAKVGVSGDSSIVKDNKSSSPAGEASPHNRMYCLDDLETVATVGESLKHVPEMNGQRRPGVSGGPGAEP